MSLKGASAKKTTTIPSQAGIGRGPALCRIHDYINEITICSGAFCKIIAAKQFVCKRLHLNVFTQCTTSLKK